MYRGLLLLGTTEIANASRAAAYTRAAECSGRTNVTVVNDTSWPATHVYLAQPPYTAPDADSAPWFDPAVPETGEFHGVWPMSIEGLDSTQIVRESGQAAGDGGFFGVPRAPIRRVKVEALLLASTPAGGEYGLTWLGEALQAERCDPGTDPRALRFLRSAPLMAVGQTTPDVMAAGLREERTLLDTVCSQMPEVKARFGRYLPEGRQMTCARIEFELSAGNPWLWGPLRQLVAPRLLSSGTPITASFERQVGGVCPSACAPITPRLTDPTRPPVVPLPRPITPQATVGCEPLESKRTTVVVPSSAIAGWETVVPNVIIRTGGAAERNIRVQWVRGTGTVDLQCATVGEAMIGYVPANAVLELDGVTGRAVAAYGGRSGIDASAVVSGRAGGPWRAPDLLCGSAHTVVVDAASTVGATTSVEVVGRARQR